MERWNNKVAVVTGASSGIGAACAKDLAENGMKVIGLSRHPERIENLINDLKANSKHYLHAMKCDVSREHDVVQTFASINKKFGGVDVLINSAGIVRTTPLLNNSNFDDMKDVIDTNVMGVVYCTREAFKSMKLRNVDGHVVIINSITGHKVPANNGDFSFNIYPASKHALTGMTEIYRREFLDNNTRVKITSISPGAVRTEILPNDYYNNIPCLRAEDVADAIRYALCKPPNVQIHELIIKPIGEPF